MREGGADYPRGDIGGVGETNLYITNELEGSLQDGKIPWMRYLVAYILLIMVATRKYRPFYDRYAPQ
ncbi:MAG: hypothetical protein A2Z06_03310 [Candidatus Glassbacteria bacterium RBG_16_58_8]|uniref:Uncharacterized protein n=1 Tax=Candidatus Glassbacteria bacterium RBG_16_58_8 TaxID=1817866 RepID=A0A1F5YA60_9BACT|nr:MAG: hypothetical protein A2Z06_03310 [Candidatus Glassbacteria bacterium RBG_16_58_8]